MRKKIALLALALLIGCGKSESSGDDDKPRRLSSKDEKSTLGDDVLIETHEKASIAWSVTSDGAVSAQVKTPDGQPVTEKVEGTIRWKSATGEAKSASLVSDPKKGVLVAQGPRLEADLTELEYTVTKDGAPLTGTLHLPPGGTAAIVADAKVSASVTVAADAKGPHGGVIQVVGDDRVEVVSEEGGEEVRVYVLNEKLEPVEVGDRTITIAVVSERGPEVVVLTPIEGKVYFVGKWRVVGEPARVTVVVRRPGRVRVAIIGWRPGVVLIVGRSAPRIKVRVKAWGGANVKIKEGGPGGLKIDIKEHKGKTKIKFK